MSLAYDHNLPFDEADRLITLEQTAFYCGVCRQSIANWARRVISPRR